MIGTIDEIKIEGEEDGFHLTIYLDDGGVLTYRIGLPDQFDAEVRRTIGAWLTEGEGVRLTGVSMYRLPEGAGILPDDPKNPDYHDTMSGLYDNREGK